MSKPILLLLASLLLAGCTGTLQVGIERTSTPDVAPAATIAALLADNNRLATQVAFQVTPTPAPLTLGRLAYVQGGDIWVKTLPSGIPLRLTTDGHNMDPTWSPSGEWLAFRKDRQMIVEQEVPCEDLKLRNQLCMKSTTVVQRQVWVIEASATSVHPLYEGASVDAFAWSPTDDRLAYLAAPIGLSIINADGTGLVTVVSHAPADRTSRGRVGRFAWNPEGTSLAYEWRTLASEQPSSYQGLWKVSTDGKTLVELYDSGFPKKGEVTLAGWSPLGKRVLFWQSDVPYAPLTDGVPLYAVNTDRDQPKSAAVRLGAEESVLSYSDFVAPAPRGARPDVRDAVALVVGASRATWRNKRIELAGRDLSSQGLAAVSPAWSPDGSLLAFSAMPDGADLGSGESARQELMQRRIWITNVAGEPRPQRITNSPVYRDEYPLWSADGSHILFARLDARGRASVWIMAADGSSSRQVVDELTPAPDPVLSYGHVDWDAWFDWWRGI